MKKLLYLFPYNLGCAGVDVKVKGQIAALSDEYNVELLTLYSFSKQTTTFEKLIKLFLSQFIFLWATLRYKTIYYRYSAFMPLYNFMLIAASLFRNIWIEYNTVVRHELEEQWPWVIPLHKLQIKLLKLTKAKHIAVTEEIKKKEFLPQNTVVMPNGYLQTCGKTGLLNEELSEVTARIKRNKQQGKKILVFVGNDYPWNGLDRIANLVDKLDNVYLLVIGSVQTCQEIYQLVSKEKCYCLGFVNPEYLPGIYKLSDIGIGTFALDKKGMIEACPLKVREYLWFGLPVIINYEDALTNEIWSKDFMHKVNWLDISKTQTFIQTNFNKEHISKEAQYQLNWKTIFQNAGVL